MEYKKKLLLNWVFIGALVLLLLNDHHWKWTFSNYLTGKLSDFAGLLILPLFLAYFLPKQQQKWALYLSGLFFLFWKSPYSEQFIDAYNQLAPIPISRVVDYSDLIALMILPLAGYLIKSIHRLPFLHLRGNLLSTPILVAITLFSFVATSPPPHFYLTYNSQQGNIQFYRTNYYLKMPKSVVLNKLHDLGLKVEIDSIVETIILEEGLLTDTLTNDIHQYYLIKELTLEEDTLRNIQFRLQQVSENKTRFFLNALSTTNSVDSLQVEHRLREIYKKFLKKEVIRSIKKS